MGSGSGNYLYKEVVFQSNDNTLANAHTVATVSDWDATSNTLSVTNIVGEFIDNISVIGSTSNTHYTLSTFNPLDVNLHNEKYDNFYINQQANTIINFSETNPFGSI